MKVLLIGVGKLGYKLAQSMLNSRIDITLVDQNRKVLERINDHLDVLTVMANGVDIGALKELHMKSYDLLIATTDSDENNAMICTIAKKLGCKQTIARVRNPEYARQLGFLKSEMGIDHIVNPELATATEIVRYLMKSYTIHVEDFARGKVSEVDFNIRAEEAFVGKKISELKGMEGMLVTAISRNGKIIIPHGSTELEAEDILHMIGKSDKFLDLIEQFNVNMDRRHIKRVMILGGGKIGYYLAEKLASLNIKVRIIEQDREHCKQLSERLDNALVIHGDGTDINLLEEEDLAAMDAFIGVTGFDEQNLLMALMAKQAGVKKVIAKVSRPSYSQVIDKLGIDVAFNPTNIAANDILKFIRGGRVVSVSLFLGGQAEVTEIIVGENASIIGKPIAELGLPKGIIIGAVVHKKEVIVPNGRTVLSPDDRIIVFCTADNVQSLEVFFKQKKEGILSELWHGNKGVRKSIDC